MHREEVRRSLNPGCPQCFETFQPLLIPDPESFGAYAGWRPKEYPEPLELPTDRAPGLPQRPDTGEEAGDTARRGARLRDLQARLESRQRRMEAAVAAEQYEQAARLRDEIQSLRHELAAVDGGEAPPGAEGGP
jgi:protein-arginine kinase activator protein McsA